MTSKEMILLRKKILKENMHKNELQILNNYETNGFRYNIGNFILFLSVLVHILSMLDILSNNISVVHYFAIVCAIPIYVTRSGFRESCFTTMFYPKAIFQTSNENTLNGINLYLKHLHDEKLDEDELKSYKIYKYDVNEIIIVRFAINLGVILLLILGVFHGLINISVIALYG